MGWWIGDYVQSGLIVELICYLVCIVGSIVLHELAHGWAAIALGDDTPKRLGHMTPNPLVHMGMWSLAMLVFIGIAWGAMPTDPSRYRGNRRRGRALVALAGPAMNVALAAVFLTALPLWLRFGTPGTPFYANLASFLWIGGALNLLLVLFNLLPVPPLDGSAILSGLSFTYYRWQMTEKANMIGMFVILALFLSGVGGLIFWGGSWLGALVYVDGLGGMLGNPPILDVVRIP